MEHINMAKYNLVLDVNLCQVKNKLEEGQTFDEYIANNFFKPITDRLDELGIQGGISFQNYAHFYFLDRQDEIEAEESPSTMD